MRKILISLVLSIALSTFSSSVFASLVEVDNTLYNLTVMEGTFIDLEEQLTEQVWWGDDNLAYKFAMALGNKFGFPNTNFDFVDGPYFAFETFIEVFDSELFELFNAQTCSPYMNEPCDVFETPGPLYLEEFYFAKSAIVPVPAAVWLFGSALIGIAGITRRKHI